MFGFVVVLSACSLAAGPTAGHVVAWNYTTLVPNDLPPNLTNIVSVSAAAAGNYYSENLALRADGTVIAWGKNSSGQTKTNVPAGVHDVIAVAAGADHFLALKNDGTVFAWRDTTLLSVPANVTNIAAIAAGPGGYSLALNKAGKVISWTVGATSYSLPQGLDSDVRAIAAASSSFVAVKSNGVAVAWGNNNLGQTNVPSDIGNLTTAAIDYLHGLGLRSDETVVAWGGNWDGQTNVPVGLSNVVAVATGGVKGSHNLVLKADGTVLTWGASQTAIPAGVSNVVAIAAGDYYNLAVVADWQVCLDGMTNRRPMIQFHSFAGQHYAVEFTTNGISGNWFPLGSSNLSGTGGQIIVTDTNEPTPSRFYRVKRW